MLVLGIDTSGPACDIALTEDGTCLHEQREDMTRGQDARLPGLISAAFERAGRSMQDLERIGVVTGPGSFTGVRVGISFARGLSLALNVPCIGITSLQAALPAGQQGSAIAALPAKRRPPEISYWAQRFRTGEAVAAPEEIGLEALCSELRAHPHLVFGHGLHALTDHLSGLQTHEARPTARRTAIIAASRTVETSPAHPVYVRSPDAALPGGKRP